MSREWTLADSVTDNCEQRATRNCEYTRDALIGITNALKGPFHTPARIQITIVNDKSECDLHQLSTRVGNMHDD